MLSSPKGVELNAFPKRRSIKRFWSFSLQCIPSSPKDVKLNAFDAFFPFKACLQVPNRLVWTLSMLSRLRHAVKSERCQIEINVLDVFSPLRNAFKSRRGYVERYAFKKGVKLNAFDVFSLWDMPLSPKGAELNGVWRFSLKVEGMPSSTKGVEKFFNAFDASFETCLQVPKRFGIKRFWRFLPIKACLQAFKFQRGWIKM